MTEREISREISRERERERQNSREREEIRKERERVVSEHNHLTKLEIKIILNSFVSQFSKKKIKKNILLFLHHKAFFLLR